MKKFLFCAVAVVLLVVVWSRLRMSEPSPPDEVMHCFVTEQEEVKCFDNLADYKKGMGIGPGEMGIAHASWAKRKQYNFGVNSSKKVIDAFLDKLRGQDEP